MLGRIIVRSFIITIVCVYFQVQASSEVHFGNIRDLQDLGMFVQGEDVGKVATLSIILMILFCSILRHVRCVEYVVAHTRLQ